MNGIYSNFVSCSLAPQVIIVQILDVFFAGLLTQPMAGQPLNFWGLHNLIGKIEFNCLFHGPLAEWVYPKVTFPVTNIAPENGWLE